MLAVAVFASAAAPAFASTCCPSDDRTNPKAMSSGMDRAAPVEQNLSLDSAWRVYAFERDGIPYLRIDDSVGVVRAAVGYIGDTVWTLPMGIDADRVSTPQRRLVVPAGAARWLVYRTDEMELVAYSSADGVIWSIEAPTGTP